MLIASCGGERVEADSAERHVPYCCPGCDRPVTLKRGAGGASRISADFYGKKGPFG
jgi:ribosomal protein L37AE/L43A